MSDTDATVLADEAQERSEFGAGIVVCLAKFSEHLSDDRAARYRRSLWWHQQSEERRAKDLQEAAAFPRGDAARRVADARSVFMGIRESPEHELSAALEMWANAASDHFYDLDERAPAALKELAQLTLTMGHGFSERIWTADDWKRIYELWRESCLAVDEMLGVTADWGEW